MNRQFESTAITRRAASILAAAAIAATGFLPTAQAQVRGPQIISSGTSIRIRVETDIRSTNVQIGDAFRASVVSPVTSAQGETAIPAGTTVNGEVISVEAARRWGQPSGVTLRMNTLTSPTGESLNLAADLTDQSGRTLPTVENLTRGTELNLRLARTLSVPQSFYLDASSQGDDFFDSIATVQQAQTVLRDLGYYTGPIDGRLTQNTRLAISSFQRDQRVAATGFLDRQTIDRLGLIGEGGQEVSVVTVISADAATRNGQLVIRMTAQTPAANWQVFEDHFRQRDTMHIYVRGIRSGVGAQVGTQKTLDVTLEPNEWQGLRRVVIHGQGRNVEILSDRFVDSTGLLTVEEATALEQQISRTLSDYARQLGLRYNPLNGQLVFTRANYRENEIELLFALNSLSQSARLYTQILRGSSDPEGLKGATDLFVAQANQVERVVARTRSPRANIVTQQWATIADTFERIESNDGDFNRQGVGYR